MTKLRDSYRVDVELWAGYPHWAPYEIEHLAVDADPEKLEGETDFEFTQEEMEIRKKVRRALDRHNRGRTTKGEFKPMEAIEILKRHGIQLPSSLVEAVFHFNDPKAKSENSDDGAEKPTTTTASGSTKEAKTVRRILLGIAVEKYRYDPDHKNSAIANIVQDLERAGLRADKGTILNHLREAVNELSAGQDLHFQTYLKDRRRS